MRRANIRSPADAPVGANGSTRAHPRSADRNAPIFPVRTHRVSPIVDDDDPAVKAMNAGVAIFARASDLDGASTPTATRPIADDQTKDETLRKMLRDFAGRPESSETVQRK